MGAFFVPDEINGIGQMIQTQYIDSTILEAVNGSYSEDPLTKILILEDEAEQLLERNDVVIIDRITFIRNHVANNLG